MQLATDKRYILCFTNHSIKISTSSPIPNERKPFNAYKHFIYALILQFVVSCMHIIITNSEAHNFLRCITVNKQQQVMIILFILLCSNRKTATALPLAKLNFTIFTTPKMFILQHNPYVTLVAISPLLLCKAH